MVASFSTDVPRLWSQSIVPQGPGPTNSPCGSIGEAASVDNAQRPWALRAESASMSNTRLPLARAPGCAQHGSYVALSSNSRPLDRATSRAAPNTLKTGDSRVPTNIPTSGELKRRKIAALLSQQGPIRTSVSALKRVREDDSGARSNETSKRLRLEEDPSFMMSRIKPEYDTSAAQCIPLQSGRQRTPHCVVLLTHQRVR